MVFLRFNMLTGRYPFEFDPGEEHNVLSLYDKIQEGRFDMPKEFDPDLQDLIYGMIFSRTPFSL